MDHRGITRDDRSRIPSGTFALQQRSRISGTTTLTHSQQSCSRTLQQGRILRPLRRLLLTPAAFSADSSIKNSLQETRKRLKLQLHTLRWRHDAKTEAAFLLATTTPVCNSEKFRKCSENTISRASQGCLCSGLLFCVPERAERCRRRLTAPPSGRMPSQQLVLSMMSSFNCFVA